MARPREFCEVTALDRVTQVFWQRGFAATTINDLVEATGLQKQSLYNTFGDKEQLFARALDNYRAKTLEMVRPLSNEGAGLGELRAFILAGLARQHESQCGSCMVTRVTMDQHVTDPEVRKTAQDAAVNLRRLVAKVLAGAKRRGEVRESLEPDEGARFVYALSNGLSALASSGASLPQLEETLDFGLAGFRPR